MVKNTKVLNSRLESSFGSFFLIIIVLLVSSNSCKIKALKLGGNIWDAVQNWSALKKILTTKRNKETGFFGLGGGGGV